MDFQEYLKDISIIMGPSFEGFQMEGIFSIPAMHCSLSLEWSTWYYLKSALKQLFNNRNHYPLTTETNADKLFFNQTDREDHVKNFEAIVSTAVNKDVMRTYVTPGKWAKPAIIWGRIKDFAGWLLRWKKTRLTFREFAYVAGYAQMSKEAQQQFEKIDLKKYRAVIFYYDWNWISNVLEQMAEKAGCKTVSLQHGMPVCKPVLPQDDRFEAIKATGSQYFIAWNEISKKFICEASALPEERAVALGMPRCIDTVLPEMSGRQKKAFGVAVTISEYEDLQLIKVANELAHILKMKFYVRYHPLQVGNEYDKFCEEDVYAGSMSSQNGVSVEEYAEKVSFTLVGRSTMLLDLLCLGSRAYHYMDAEGNGFYKDTPQCSFCCAEQVVGYEKDLAATVVQLKALRDSLTGGERVRQNYTDYFAEI